MDDKQTIVLVVFILIAIILAILAIIRIYKSTQLEKTQKIVNTIMIFLLPIIWSAFILIFFSKPKKARNDGYKYREAGYSNYTRWGG